MTQPITEDDVRTSLGLHSLLQVCRGAAEYLSDKLEKDPETQDLAGALPGVMALTIEKFWEVQNALVRECVYGASPADDGEPLPRCASRYRLPGSKCSSDGIWPRGGQRCG